MFYLSVLPPAQPALRNLERRVLVVRELLHLRVDVRGAGRAREELADLDPDPAVTVREDAAEEEAAMGRRFRGGDGAA